MLDANHTYRPTRSRVVRKKDWRHYWWPMRDDQGRWYSGCVRYCWGEYTLTPMNRALRVMRYYENRSLTHHWAYRQAQRIAVSFLLPASTLRFKRAEGQPSAATTGDVIE